MDINEVKAAIDAYFGDMKRSKRETKEGLEEIAEHAQVSADTLREELQREGE